MKNFTDDEMKGLLTTAKAYSEVHGCRGFPGDSLP